MPKRTYQPKTMRRLKRLGYRSRMSTPGGKKVIKSRKRKGRKKLSISDEYRSLSKKPKNRNK